MRLAEATIARVVAMWDRWQRAVGDHDSVSVVVVAGETFVAAPARLRSRLDPAPIELDAVVQAVGTDLERVVGAATLWYADRGSVRLPSTAGILRLADDDPRWRALEVSSDPSEWREASADEAADARFGSVEESGALVAVATTRVWDATVGHYGVFTRRDCRGNGLAGRVAAAAIAETLDLGLVPQWRARTVNAASQRVADRLGFVRLGHQVTVRVKTS